MRKTPFDFKKFILVFIFFFVATFIISLIWDSDFDEVGLNLLCCGALSLVAAILSTVLKRKKE